MNEEIELYGLIDNNEYVKNCFSNKNKEKSSLSYLIDYQISQSDCIKLGIGLEKILLDIILYNNKNLINIKVKNVKGQKEKDHLFLDETTKIIYYAELKANSNLDTEKCKSTSAKCISILNELQIEYPDYKIEMFLVCGRYLSKNDIPKNIVNKFSNITENVVGVNEYLCNLGIVNTTFEKYETYKNFLNYLTKQMFNL